MFKKFRLVWADKLTLLMALVVAVVSVLVWLLGIVALDGLSQSRLDRAIMDWTIQAELALVLPLWMVLRVIDFSMRTLGRWLWPNRLRHTSS